MSEQAVARISEKTGATPEEALERIASLSPQGRLIRPQEIAHAVLMLCGKDAEGINGQTIVIDGYGH
ncbi:MAG: SDR family oxidoreductase [Acidobacteria bacterium]|nr:SDR family oxidoreductase [Acidobacteriota bacterium]